VDNTNSVDPDRPDRKDLVNSEQFGDINEKPFEEAVMARIGWEKWLRKSGMVSLDRKPITTFDTIRKNHATFIPEPVWQEKKQRSHAGTNSTKSRGATGTPDKSGTPAALPRLTTPKETPATSRSSARSQIPHTMQNVPSHQALVTRTLVRLVFDRPGWPIERFMSKRELLEAMKMIVEGNVCPGAFEHAR
jgi:hypothetical protein